MSRDENLTADYTDGIRDGPQLEFRHLLFALLPNPCYPRNPQFKGFPIR